MGSTFGGLNIATTSLAAQRRAIETAGHNIANVNTPGYSRQRVDMVAHTSGAAGIHTGTLSQPGGVAIAAQTRITDIFVTERLNRETAALGSATVLSDALGVIESAFNEPGENGLAAQLEGFWDAWDTVVTRPEDLSVRTALLQKSQAVTDGFNSLHRRIGQVATDALDRAGTVVADVNRITAGIAELNETIAAQLATGEASNDLLDQRDRLVQDLSHHLGVSTRVQDNGMLTVFASGSTLVSGNRSTDIALDRPAFGSTDPAVLRIAGSGTPIQASSGTIPALLQINNALVPDQLAALDDVAVSLAESVNTVHGGGYDLDGNPGATFFKFDPASPGSAHGLRVDATLLANPGGVAASSIAPDPANPDAGRYDGGNAAAIAEISRRATDPNAAPADRNPDEVYRSMVATLGVGTNAANARSSLQDQVVQKLHDERDAISGVSLDEEMTNLIAFQQAYQASARYLTAVDEMLSTLINSTGLVGR